MYSTRAIQDNVIVSHGTLLTCVPEDLAARTIQRELLAQSLNLLHGSAADEPKIKSVKKPDTSGTLALRHRISLSSVPLGLPATPLGLAFCFFRFSNTRSSAPASLLVVTNLLSSPRPRPCFHLSLVQGATESLV